MAENFMRYWATLPPDELAKRAYDKVRDYRRWFRNTGYATKCLKGWTYANGMNDAGEISSHLQMGGENAQLVKTVINGVRPLRQRIVAAVMSGAPEMQPVASNSDAAAREQADLGRGILEHIHRVHRREVRDKKCLDMAVDMGLGALVIEWDARKGKPLAMEPETDEAGQPVLDESGMPSAQPAAWEGDFVYWLASVFDVYLDAGLRDRMDTRWIVARRAVSKWALAARYPEKMERILSASETNIAEDALDVFSIRMLYSSLIETDMVWEYVLWHLDGPELEGGREFRFLSNGTWLSDGPYPYDGDMLPVFPLSPDEVACTALGYSNIFDVLGVSDVINAVASAMATNLTTNMVPPLVNYVGSGLAPGTPIGTGHKVVTISRPELKPEPLEMPQTPPEAYKALEVLERWRLEGMGLNETSIGRPPYSGMAAQAMALLDSKVDQYNEGLQKGVLRYLEATATFELRVLKRYASEPRIAQVAGKSKQWMAKAYTSDDLSLIDAVHVEPVGAASRTLAGKFGLLETFANFGVPLKPEQIVELTRTGNYEADSESVMAQRYGIAEENEALRTGQLPHRALITDRHWDHIREHLTLTDSPEARKDPNSPLVEAVLSAVTEHLELWRSMPPDLLLLMGGPPPPPPPGMGMEIGAPAGPEAPQGGSAPTGDAAGAVNALAPDANEPELPQPPQAA